MPQNNLQTYYAKSDAQIDRRYQSEGFIGGGAVQFVDGGSIAMEALPPILRTLLVTDGTVTKLLEAYFWEPIHVETQRLEVVQLTAALPWLKAEVGESMLLREVELRGIGSGVCYATAFSMVRLAVFEPDLVESLCQGKVGLGVLIRDSGLESYRELLELVAHQGDAPSQAAADIDDMQMQRSYRIIANGVPAILITETFPCSIYRSRPSPKV